MLSRQHFVLVSGAKSLTSWVLLYEDVSVIKCPMCLEIETYHHILSDCSKTLKFRHKFNIDLQNKDILQLREIQKKSDLEKLGSYFNAVRTARGDALSKLRSVPAPRENLLCVECQDEG